MNSWKIVPDGTGGRKSKALQEILADLKKGQKVEKSFEEGRTSSQGGSGEKEMELKHFTKVEEGGKEKFCRRKCKQVDKEDLEKKK